MKDFLEKLSAECCTDFEFRNTIDLAPAIFNNKDALDANGLYFTRFHRIPNCIHLSDIDCQKANEWLSQNHQDNIKDCCFTKRNRMRPGVISGRCGKGDKIHFDDVYYFLFDDLLVYLNHNDSDAKILYRKTDNNLVDSVVNEIKKFKKRKTYTRKKPEIELLLSGSSVLSTTSMVVSKPNTKPLS